MMSQLSFSIKLLHGISEPDAICENGVHTDTVITGISGVQFSQTGPIVYFISALAMQTAQKATGWTACNGDKPALVVETYQNEQSVSMICCRRDNSQLFYSDWMIAHKAMVLEKKSPEPDLFRLSLFCGGYFLGLGVKKVRFQLARLNSCISRFIERMRKEYLLSKKEKQ